MYAIESRIELIMAKLIGVCMIDQRKTERKESWGGLFMHVYVGIYYKESDDYLECMHVWIFLTLAHIR